MRHDPPQEFFREVLRQTEDGSLVIVRVWRSGGLLFRKIIPVTDQQEEAPRRDPRHHTQGEMQS